MTQPAIAPDIHQPLDVHLNLLAQVTFDPALLVDDRAYAIHFFFAEFADAFVDTHSRVSENLIRARSSDAVNVRETDFSSFVSWQVYTCDACHSSSIRHRLEPAPLPLPLFMFRIGANHSHDTPAVNDLAVVAHFLYRSPDFHVLLFLAAMMPLCWENPLDDKR